VAYAIAALLSVLAFLAGVLAGRHRALVGYVVVLALLLSKAVLNHRPDWEFALFAWEGYEYFQGYLVYPLGLACLGIAVGWLKPGRNRRAVAILAAFLFAVSLWNERWVVLEPDTSSPARASVNHHCVQTTVYSCGPAACVSLLSYLDIETTEGEMIGLCRTPAYGGTSLFRIVRGLRRKLPSASYEVRIVDGDPDSLRALTDLAIVTVHKVHVVAVHFDGEEVDVHDPAKALPERLSFAEYRERFGGSAVAITPRIRPAAGG
jgi:hypothetical protein